MTFTRTFSHALIVLLTVSASPRAQSASEPDELEQFLDLLEQQTSLATQTRLNADFVPGMFSVINSEQLQRRGFRTVWEALASIPGVLATMNETGSRSITVRGVGNLFEPSKVKLLLNGKSLNASASSTTGTLFDTPIEQVERIEFIRGPGSAIHGEFSFAGVLNVITRNLGQQFSAGFESGDGINFAALYSFGDAQNDFRTSLNFAASETDGVNILAGADRSAIGDPSFSPGPINNKRDFVSAIVNIESGDLETLIQLQQSNRGDHFGTNNLLPPDNKQTVISESLVSADLGYSFDLSEQLSGGWSLNMLHSSSEQNALFLGVAEAFGGLGAEDDIVADALLEERRIEAKLDLEYDVDDHLFFAELVFTDIEVVESEQFINLDPTTNLPSPDLNQFPGPVDIDQERRSFSLVLQDEHRIDDRLTLTAGLRFDDYEDIGTNLSPRIALVWRQSEQNIFKVQLARAFKPPSLIEVGGAIESSIEPETNDTLEFGYIYHGTDLIIRNTIYYSQLDDLIVFQDFAPFGFRNTDTFNLRGYELELEKSIANKWDIIASLSLQDYIDDELPGAAPWMIKAGVEYQLLPLTTVHFQLNSVGKRNREASDTRDDFKQVTQADLTLRSQNFLGFNGLDFRLGVLNILDRDLLIPSPTDTYVDDYPYSDGATLWAQWIYQP